MLAVTTEFVFQTSLQLTLLLVCRHRYMYMRRLQCLGYLTTSTAALMGAFAYAEFML